MTEKSARLIPQSLYDRYMRFEGESRGSICELGATLFQIDIRGLTVCRK